MQIETRRYHYAPVRMEYYSAFTKKEILPFATM
jgi:hypothetical protein